MTKEWSTGRVQHRHRREATRSKANRRWLEQAVVGERATTTERMSILVHYAGIRKPQIQTTPSRERESSPVPLGPEYIVSLSSTFHGRQAHALRLSCSSVSAHPLPDYSAFASPDFDPGDYANTILATGPKSSAGDLPPKQDASVAISRLTSGIDDVSKQIKQLVCIPHLSPRLFSAPASPSQVTTHHEALLSQASSVSDIESPLTSVKQGLTELDSSLDK